MKNKLGYITLAIIVICILVSKIIEFPMASIRVSVGAVGTILICLAYGLIKQKLRKGK